MDEIQAGGGFQRGIKQVVLRSSVCTVVVVVPPVLGQHFFPDRMMTYSQVLTSSKLKVTNAVIDEVSPQVEGKSPNTTAT